MNKVLKSQISIALNSNPYLFGTILQLEEERGRVVLHGTVPSYYHKQLLQETIRRVEGVSEISNEVHVARMAGHVNRREEII